MNMKLYVFLFFLFPFNLFAQNVIVVSRYAINKQGHSKDSVKSIAYPFIQIQEESAGKINNTIKALVFNHKEYDTAKPLQLLLNTIYKKDTGFKMRYLVTRNKNGLLSLTITIIPSTGERKPPLYLNFDLNTGNLITISTMLKTRNDSISFRQAIIPTITDSIRLFEQGIDINNPKYSDIIEWLNNALSNFRQNYPSNYSMTDGQLTVYFDCFIPPTLLPYNHTYKVTFAYRTFKNTFKPEYVKKLN